MNRLIGDLLDAIKLSRVACRSDGDWPSRRSRAGRRERETSGRGTEIASRRASRSGTPRSRRSRATRTGLRQPARQRDQVHANGGRWVRPGNGNRSSSRFRQWPWRRAGESAASVRSLRQANRSDRRGVGLACRSRRNRRSSRWADLGREEVGREASFASRSRPPRATEAAERRNCCDGIHGKSHGKGNSDSANCRSGSLRAGAADAPGAICAFSVAVSVSSVAKGRCYAAVSGSSPPSPAAPSRTLTAGAARQSSRPGSCGAHRAI